MGSVTCTVHAHLVRAVTLCNTVQTTDVRFCCAGAMFIKELNERLQHCHSERDATTQL